MGAGGKERAGYTETFQANPGKLVRVTNPSYCRARARAWVGPGFSVAQAASVSNQSLKHVHLPNAKQTETLRHRPTHMLLPRRGPPRSSRASPGQRPVSTAKAWLPFSLPAPRKQPLCLTPVCQTLCFRAECEMLSCSFPPRLGQELGYRSDSPAGCGQDDQCPERVGQDTALCLELQAPHTD